jgi:predicted XRE-type DNA-binding protein
VPISLAGTPQERPPTNRRRRTGAEKPNAEQELLKAQLALQIYRIVKQRGLTRTQAAKALGIKQPHVSLLMRNRAGTFSVGRLIDFLTALGQDVEITVRPTRKQRGDMSATVV